MLRLFQGPLIPLPQNKKPPGSKSEPGGNALGSEDRNNSAVVGLFDVFLHSVGLERLDKCLDLGAVFFACAAGNDVGVGLCGVAGSVFNGKRIRGMEASLQRVVAVDNSDRTGVGVGQLCGDGIGLQRLHVMALRVDDIQRGHALFGGSIGGQLNEAFLRQQEQSTRLVGVVGGDQDGCVGGNVRNRGNTVAVQAERLIVDLGCGDEIGST